MRSQSDDRAIGRLWLTTGRADSCDFLTRLLILPRLSEPRMMKKRKGSSSARFRVLSFFEVALRMTSKARASCIFTNEERSAPANRTNCRKQEEDIPRNRSDSSATPAALQLTRPAIIRYLNETSVPFRNECVLCSNYSAKS